MITIRKAYPADEELVLSFFKKYDETTDFHENKRLIFSQPFSSQPDFCGLIVEDNNTIIAFLGLIFSDRLIKNKRQVVCNLTSFLIHPSFRGRGITHHVVSHLKTLGDFILTALTPIPSLYSMYEKQGLQKITDERDIYWTLKSGTTKPIFQRIDDNSIEALNYSTHETTRIYHAHKSLNGICVYFMVIDKPILVIGRVYEQVLRKFKTGRWINYADWICRKGLRMSFLDKRVRVFEFSYSNEMELVNHHFESFLSIIRLNYHVDGMIVRRDKIPLKKNIDSDTFWHSRRLYLTQGIPLSDLDDLYSEIFLL